MDGLLDCRLLPPFGSIVFCRWPREPSANPARRVVLIDSDDREMNNGSFRAGVVRVVYGSSRFDRPEASEYDILIENFDEAKRCGLTGPTRFYICEPYIKTMMWKEDRFVNPGYIKDQGIVAGRFTFDRREELQAKLAAFAASRVQTIA